jgi:Ca2+-binding RTX toxin-like protein
MAIVNGTSGDDQYPNPEVKGTEAADQLFGLAGDDTLIGFGGDDVLEGGKGADQLFGSTGFDLASYKGSTAGVSVNLLGLPKEGGDAAGDELYSIDGLIGSAFTDGLAGDDLRNVLRGGGSGDDIGGNGGDDALYGDGGGDLIGGGYGNDRLYGGDGNDRLIGGDGGDVLEGGAGADTASYRDSAQAVRVDLAAGTGLGGEAEGDRLSGVENLIGSGFGDRLVGNGGANALTGRGGFDVLVGNGGADRFVYESRYDSNPKAPDVIRDFSRSQGDKIDLRGVDANEQVDGDQAFQFVGQAQPTSAGQLRFFQRDGDTYVEADVSDAVAGGELQFVLDPLVSLQGTDFLL